MLKLKQFEKFIEYRDKYEDLWTVPTHVLIDELRNRAGVDVNFVDYGTNLQISKGGPCVMITIHVDETEEGETP
jgi:hypothetical protein